MSVTPPVPPPELLARIAADLTPVSPRPSPIRRALVWAPAAAALYLVVPLAGGLRSDAPVLGPWMTWLVSAFQVALGVWLVWAGGRDYVAGRRLAVSVSTVLLAIAALVVVGVTSVTYAISPTGVPLGLTAWHSSTFCFRGSLAVGAPLLFGAAWLLGRALPGKPWLAGTLFGAGAGLSADAAWRLVCPASDPWHVLTSHGGAVVVLALVGAIGAALTAPRPLAR